MLVEKIKNLIRTSDIGGQKKEVENARRATRNSLVFVVDIF